MLNRSTFVRGGLVLVLAAFAIGTALAQIPDEFENLEVLPKDISKRELVSIMRQFAGSLGQRCSFCHVGGENPNSLEGMDFKSDELEHKRTARVMMKMVYDINQNHIGELDKESPLRVQCITCHRGVKEPEPVDDILLGVIKSDGLEAGAARYKELREEYYGSGSYDFTSGPLNAVAEDLAKQQNLDGAVTIMKMNIDFNPDESYPHLLLGQIYAQNGDKDAAIASMERALEIDPENDWARQTLERVRSGD
jgi:tetratricopeptide (TPR) repeat protein